jgi:hypothetical protein
MNEKTQLAVNPETVGYIAAMAREFHAKEEVTIPEEPLSSTSDWAMQVLADHIDDPTYNELKFTIDDLEPDQQVHLVALMWLGRGTFSIEEWEDALQEAGDSWTNNTAGYLIGTPLLADYLEEGLSQLGYSAEDYEVS